MLKHSSVFVEHSDDLRHLRFYAREALVCLVFQRHVLPFQL
jgi:hypothetical protein